MERKALRLLVIVLLAFASARAGVVPGRWDKVQAEKPGTEMIVILTSGDEIQGMYQEVGSQELRIAVDGAQRALPKSGIARITTAERRTGPLWNGPLIGAIIGGSLAAIGIAAYERLDSETLPYVAAWAGIGAGIGLGIDAAVQSRITLYKAPGME